MKPLLKKVLLVLAILIAVVAVTALVFIRNLSRRAIPDYDRDVSLEGLHAPVEVYRDSFAIPHVYAQDEHDLYLVTGYLLAQDRLWQMDLLRRVSQGRLSEIFGADYVDTDLLLRALRFERKSERILSSEDPAFVAGLTAFCDGINHFIRNHKHRLPPEFGILGYKPEYWEPVHSLNLIGYMAWDLKAGWNEILLNEIRPEVDSARYRQLLPDLHRPQPAVYAGKGGNSPVSVCPDLLLHNRLLEPLGADAFDASNNWAVSGNRSTTGMPLLANDMHLGLNIPGIWYQMHQVAEGRLNVTGLVLPGAPPVICGHNDSIAWGMTNTYVDNLDFYEETTNPADSLQYEYNGGWRNFYSEKVIIRTGRKKQVERRLRFTHRGPVVSTFKKMADKVVSMHWVGDEPGDEFRTIMLLNRAGNWNEFREALRTFTSISQNVVYADKKGNIGLYCAAGIPIRKRDAAFGILPGNTDEYDWKGYVPFGELPCLLNPASGFVASANNRTAAAGYPYHIGTWYSLPDRFNRICELLSAKTAFSSGDFRNMQLDRHSAMAERFLPVFLKALAEDDNMNAPEKKAYVLLKGWDYSMATESAAAAIFETLYLELARCIFSDELGSLFNDLNRVVSIKRNAMDQLMDLTISPWFDDVLTPEKKESLDDDIRCAFSAAVARLQARTGNDSASWNWGKVHRLVLKHPLSSVKILDRIFGLNTDSIPLEGSFHTLSAFSYDESRPFDVYYGPSQRHIFDVGDWDNSITVIPTGNSGIPASPHYCDQTPLFVTGKYHHDYFTRDQIMNHARYHMTFHPSTE